MEHRPLTPVCDDETISAAAANLRVTYRRLGLGIPGAVWTEEAGFDLCLGDDEFPVSNFATRLRLDPWAVGRLREIAIGRPNFHIYAMADDLPAHRAELLERQGFRIRYRLDVLVADGPVSAPLVELATAVLPAERLRTADFMGGQFFSSHTPEFRRAMAEATANRDELGLHALFDRGRVIGGAMTSRSEAMLGLYNLCVLPSRRGTGLGRAMVAWTRALAREAGLPLTLQCAPRMTSWYEYLGFSRVDTVDVYALPKVQHVDIMS